jgi:hypothetical protein
MLNGRFFLFFKVILLLLYRHLRGGQVQRQVKSDCSSCILWRAAVLLVTFFGKHRLAGEEGLPLLMEVNSVFSVVYPRDEVILETLGSSELFEALADTHLEYIVGLLNLTDVDLL